MRQRHERKVNLDENRQGSPYGSIVPAVRCSYIMRLPIGGWTSCGLIKVTGYRAKKKSSLHCAQVAQVIESDRAYFRVGHLQHPGSERAQTDCCTKTKMRQRRRGKTSCSKMLKVPGSQLG